ncbi:hypothetical protein [Flavimarina sp. Hel_I_48]|uniref:hypothetical protein n=1 Tax=Flavimarina sp. Hel_I_48 TaxID=1392488 RepID=UPI0004DF2E01|nr:hypothetical protein [Flavimarina sp. Hel_I_48]
MKTLANIKNQLIDKILLTDNADLLSAIDSIFNATQTSDSLKLDSYQLEMLMMSEKDIENGNLISEADLEKEDAKWMD